MFFCYDFDNVYVLNFEWFGNMWLFKKMNIIYIYVFFIFSYIKVRYRNW